MKLDPIHSQDSSQHSEIWQEQGQEQNHCAHLHRLPEWQQPTRPRFGGKGGAGASRAGHPELPQPLFWRQHLDLPTALGISLKVSGLPLHLLWVRSLLQRLPALRMLSFESWLLGGANCRLWRNAAACAERWSKVNLLELCTPQACAPNVWHLSIVTIQTFIRGMRNFLSFFCYMRG